MKNNFIKSLMNSFNLREREREVSQGDLSMKKEKISNNENNKKISKNNKIISSILAVAMCCQSFVGANPNSDNREFVSDEGIDNNQTADGSEEDDEVKDIKSKKNNSSSLIRNSLDVLLVAAMGSWWFYGTKNKDKDLKSKNEEIGRLEKEFEKKDKELEGKNRELGEEIEKLKKELEKIERLEEESSEDILEKEYFKLDFLEYKGKRIFTFALGKKMVIRKDEEDKGETLFYSLSSNFGGISTVFVCARRYFYSDTNYEIFDGEIRKAENKIKGELENMEPYSRFVYNVAIGREDISELTTEEKLAEKLCGLLSECESKFRLTGFYLTLRNSGKKIGDILVPQELAESVISANSEQI
ncbi:MAG: hypothetical protein CfP315_0081 [Candidatus Improbicoccus pseudotrichonymphae]|uniref:Uncharacterized protein n=1 Tax=Candidatus Improbicoccus pseudotrichonymphae TaxID=3033792 RepID=A0AA48I286_9FIRM|nr:MAG: hypothetical protein CfP315_0081 [Candidatus Improbicoccus pseudotrichonymphae]